MNSGSYNNSYNSYGSRGNGFNSAVRSREAHYDPTEPTDDYTRATFGDETSQLPSDGHQPETEEEIFKNITPGISFDNYSDIPVSMKGTNVPSPVSTFDSAGLHPKILENIRRAKYTTPTPVQMHAIPVGMAGRDLMACAQTGSGKTAAFLLPIITRLLVDAPTERSRSHKSYPLFVILAPTRELAIQVRKNDNSNISNLIV